MAKLFIVGFSKDIAEIELLKWTAMQEPKEPLAHLNGVSTGGRILSVRMA